MTVGGGARPEKWPECATICPIARELRNLMAECKACKRREGSGKG